MNEKITSYTDSSKLEHLKEGIKPIIACIGDSEEYEKEIYALMESDDVQNVDYYAENEELKNRSQKNAGELTYVFSTIDESNKFTKNLFDCTSLIVTGIDAKTGENISFLSHQRPGSFLDHDKEKFTSDLKEILREIKNRSEKGTIDAVIAGGRTEETWVRNKKGSVVFLSYEQAVDFLSSIIIKEVGFKPVVIVEPKDAGRDDIYYDNNNRRLYALKPTKKTVMEEEEQARKEFQERLEKLEEENPFKHIVVVVKADSKESDHDVYIITIDKVANKITDVHEPEFLHNALEIINEGKGKFIETVNVPKAGESAPQGWKEAYIWTEDDFEN